MDGLRVAAAMGILWCALSSDAANAQSHHAGEVTIEPYSFRTYDGAEHPAELGHLWVRENRTGNSGRLIELAFVRLKTTAAKPQSPVVFLAGGPGIPSITLARVPVYYEFFRKLQAQSDVIFPDQRGIGMSSPNLQCPKGPPLPADVFESVNSFQNALVGMVHACAEYWRGHGTDLSAYSSAESADDLEDLRRALGADKLSLIGHSYGTALALETVRRHGEHLDRIVLSGVEGPDDSLQLPYTFEFALRRLSLLAAKNAAFPDAWQQFTKLVDQLEKKPVALHLKTGQGDQTADVNAGAFLLRFAVKTMLPNGGQASRIPALLTALSNGDTSLLTTFAQGFYDGLTTGANAMTYAVLCSDGWSAGRRQIAEDQAAKSAIGEASFMQLDPGVCADLKTAKPSPDSFSPIWSTVPALLLTGTLDSNTPLHQAEEVLEGFPDGISVTIENGDHEVLPSPDVQSIVADFLSGAEIKQRTLRFDPLKFLSIEEAKKPPAH